jgi:hypothetical protein
MAKSKVLSGGGGSKKEKIAKELGQYGKEH